MTVEMVRRDVQQHGDVADRRRRDVELVGGELDYIDAVRPERRERILTAVERLRDDDRDVLACRYLLELSEDETAAALGIARGTVKSRTHRALSRLEEELR